MVPDVCALVSRDHQELDRALVAMLDEATPRDELPTLLEVFRLALAVHVAGEVAVANALLARTHVTRVLRLLVEQARHEHAEQHDAAEAIGAVAAGSSEWFGRVLELRVLVLDHGARAELMRWTFDDHVPLELRKQLASVYATERMRVLARSSPLTLARAQLTALAARA